MIVFQEQPDTGIRRMNAPVSVHTVTSKLRDSCHKTLPLELELPERGSNSPAGGAHSGAHSLPGTWHLTKAQAVFNGQSQMLKR